MNTSTDVTLPSNLEPEFPECCVVCEEQTHIRASILVDTQNALLSYLLPILFFFGWKRISFPLCPICRGRFFLQRRMRTAVSWTIVIVAVALALPYFEGWGRGTTKLAMLGVALAAILPPVFFEVFFPRWFDVTARKDTTDFEFLSSSYATKFYGANLRRYPSAKIKFDGQELTRIKGVSDE